MYFRILAQLLLLTFFPLVAGAENQLSNAGFEHGLAGYLLGDAGAISKVPFRFEPTKWGTAVTFSAEPGERIALYLPEVLYRPDTEYRLSFMARSSVDNLQLIISEYVRAGASVGSAGKFFPKLTPDWQRYSFTFKTGKEQKWGGFRLVKNYQVNQTKAELAFADLYLGPADGKSATVPPVTGSLDWDPLDRRVNSGEKLNITAKIVNRGNSARQVKIAWQLRSSASTVVAQHSFDFTAKPGVSSLPLVITPERNGIFRLDATVDGQSFVNYVKLAVTPKIRIKPGELPVDIGLNSVLSGGQSASVTDAELAFLADSGISFIRTWDGGNPFIWRELEPEDKRFNWTGADRLVEAANRAGLEVLPVLGGMFFTYPDQQPFGKLPPRGHALPLWLYRKASIVPCPPNMKQFTRIGRQTALPPMADWERMVGEVARRYQGKIHYFEVMNEPNLCLTAEQYLPYLKAAYFILKQTDPQVKVIGICATGDYDGHIISYVAEMLKLGAGKYFDDLSFHPYNNMYEDSAKSGEIVIESFYKFLNENKLKDVRLWNTELYYLNPACKGGSDHVNGPVYHPGYLIRRYLLDAAQGVRASILIPGNYMAGTALINENFQGDSPSGFFANRIIPSEKYIASAVFATLLRGCRFSGTKNLADNIRAYCFSGKNTAVAALFALHPKADDRRKLEFPALPSGVKILDLLGNPVEPDSIDGRIRVPVSPIPFYLVAPDVTVLEHVLKSIHGK